MLSDGAELGIAWDGDADRCFFIDDTGQFVDGDFLTALLAESILEKEPGAAILYDVRASRAVPDTVARAGGTAHVNRVGHAFFKSRMRDEGAAFGGEVSGHYYFRDFYCADSGTIPALLILELLSKRGKRMSELLAPLRERYFISGEINSEVADQDAKMQELAERLLVGRRELARRRVGRLRRLALQRPAVQHRAASAPQPRVARLAGRHGREARRGARADPRVSDDPFAPAAEAGIHRLAIPTPFAVGRVNVYLIEDDPLTLVDAGPNSGRALDELQRAARRARHGDRGPRAGDRHAPAHRPHRAGRDRRVALGRRGRRDRRSSSRSSRTTRERAAADDEFAGQIMLRHGIPPDVVQALQSVSLAFRAWGATATVTRELHEGDVIELRDRTLEVHFRPGHSPVRHGLLRRDRKHADRGDHLIKHISSNPLITRGPGDEGDPSKRPQSLVTYLESLRKTREHGHRPRPARPRRPDRPTTAR